MQLNLLIGSSLICLSLSACRNNDQVATDLPAMEIAYNAIIPFEDTVNYEVFAADTKTGTVENLTNHPGVDWVYHAHDDYLFLISDRDTPGGIYYLYKLNIESKQMERIYEQPVADSWLDVRYDGSEMIVCRQIGAQKSLVILDQNGNEVREILNSQYYDINDPAFSPDGNWVVFRSKRSGTDELWMMNEYGEDLRQITFYPSRKGPVNKKYYHTGPPRWQPHSENISFPSMIEDSYQIFSIRLDGTHKKQLTQIPAQSGWHSWSSDGNFLIYDGSNELNQSSDLYLLDPKTQIVHRLTDTPYSERAPIILSR